jgi:hypothetical protein
MKRNLIAPNPVAGALLLGLVPTALLTLIQEKNGSRFFFLSEKTVFFFILILHPNVWGPGGNETRSELLYDESG